MAFPVEHLATFTIICDEGSFEAAAQRLHLTPSAVSQRVRSLEQQTGAILLRRTRPVTVTESGAIVLRAARQVSQILSDTTVELGGEEAGRPRLRVVVNADSLATWFIPALAEAASAMRAEFEILRADEMDSTRYLRDGSVMAAVTASPQAVPGCVTLPLGVHRYSAVATPEFSARFFGDGVDAAAFARAPVIEFDRVDTFQQRFLARHEGADLDPPRHYVPTSTGYAQAIKLGMGWGMLPDRQCAEERANGTLVTLGPEPHIDQPLFWQRWNIHSPLLTELSAIVEAHARASLRPYTPSR